MNSSKARVLDFPEFHMRYLIQSGLYPNQQEVVRDALRSLLLTHPHYKIEVAIEAYDDGEVSLAKAGELAGLNYEEMKEVLVQRGVKLRLGPETKDDALEEVRAIREALR